MKASSNSLQHNIIFNAIKAESLFSVTIELLTTCNWKCSHCYIPEHNDFGLDKNVIFDIFYQLRNLGVFELILTGGELFIRKDILEIIERARQLFFKVTLLTNISLLDEPTVLKLSKLHLNLISCTIFSLDSDIHDSITGIEGSLEKVLTNLKLLKKYNIPTEIKSVVMDVNFPSIQNLEKHCLENGFQYTASAVVSAKHNGDITPQSHRLSDEQLYAFFKSQHEIENKFPKTFDSSDYVCSTIRYSLFIDVKGDVYPCNTFNSSVGNIFEHTIEYIWQESESLKFFRNIRWADSNICNECPHKSFCSKCPGLALLEDGDVNSKSILACSHAKIRYNLHEL